MTERNAAERLRDRFAWEDEIEDFQTMLNEALADERRAVAREILDMMKYETEDMEDGDVVGLILNRLIDIAHREAAR